MKLNDIGLLAQQLIVLHVLSRRRKSIRLAAVLIDLRSLRLVTHINKTVLDK